jgi:nucleoside-diphosphate kinase
MMLMARTLTLIKPDSMEANNAGNILARLEAEGFQILALKRLRLSKEQAESFYEVHRERPFYASRVAYMTSGPIIAVALAREDAVARLREVMGATDPANAEEGTIRALYGSSIERNAIHGSDSSENAAKELHFFFSEADLITAE